MTLLGLLVEQPRHGYELEEVITARGMREWTEIGFSSIYYLLGKLRDRGLVAEVDAPGSGRGKARKVFGPT
ncbi:MAG: PadR family transcriptional regulator, partial [Saccharothrix sp.]|nr:PadR family transcriptional regulator [Saccharothrix sp.]